MGERERHVIPSVCAVITEGVELDPCPPEVLPPQCYSTGEQVSDFTNSYEELSVSLLMCRQA